MDSTQPSPWVNPTHGQLWPVQPYRSPIAAFAFAMASSVFDVLRATFLLGQLRQLAMTRTPDACVCVCPFNCIFLLAYGEIFVAKRSFAYRRSLARLWLRLVGKHDFLLCFTATLVLHGSFFSSCKLFSNHTHTHTHTQQFNGPMSGTTQVSQ